MNNTNHEVRVMRLLILSLSRNAPDILPFVIQQFQTSITPFKRARRITGICVVVWVVMPRSHGGGQQRFERSCRVHLLGRLWVVAPCGMLHSHHVLY